jgi:hypothetical protein
MYISYMKVECLKFKISIFSYLNLCYSVVTGVKYHAFRAYSYTENFRTPSKPRPIFLFSVVALLQAKQHSCTTTIY